MTLFFLAASQRSFSRSQDVCLPCCIPTNGEKAPTFPVKLVECPEVEGGDLREAGGDPCQADGGELAAARLPTLQHPPTFSKALHTMNMLFFLAASQLKEKSLQFLRKTTNFLCISPL